jgi:hypothetical protein
MEWNGMDAILYGRRLEALPHTVFEVTSFNMFLLHLDLASLAASDTVAENTNKTKVSIKPMDTKKLPGVHSTYLIIIIVTKKILYRNRVSITPWWHTTWITHVNGIVAFGNPAGIV